ncbi:Cyclopropane-fatty-acyl-phospholipid synthase [Pseudoalteromonas luteoviolacea B = ATCC 29581]|nr:Cyclopropane-fatty-acyl-phospholipid synthase [Pseudoalteromonas luteoviolacea B = ATCC 29581]
MEKVTTLTELAENGSTLSKLYRNIVHRVFEQLEIGGLTIVEGKHRIQFGRNSEDIRIEVFNMEMYKSFALGGSVGAAESYIEGHWKTNDLTKLIELFVLNQDVLDRFEKRFSWLSGIANKIKHRLNRNTQAQSKKNIAAHYDLGNDLYRAFLSEEMLYSSAVFTSVEESLEKAQFNKLEAICQRLDLQPGERVVEIGTGWGALAIHAAKHYGVHVTTTTISEEQHDYVQEQVVVQGLEKSITLLKKDYRELTGEYDKLVSIEMIEAVGHEYLAGFFQKCNSLLKESGVMLIQAITIADQRYEHYLKQSDFIQQYIFPGGCLPSVEQMAKHLKEQTDMVMHQLSDIGIDYAHTLRHWHQRFVDAWPRLDHSKFDERFYRLWTFYLCYCEGAFRQRATSAVHLVARKPRAVTRDCQRSLNYL